MAYQEGWQEGMEEGYKIWKDKGYKEYKLVQEEEEAKKAKNQANQATTSYQDTCSTRRIVPRINATTQTDPAVPETCENIKTTHITPNSSISRNTAAWNSELLSTASGSTTSTIAPTYSLRKAQIVEIR
jgi:hypothetical protein